MVKVLINKACNFEFTIKDCLNRHKGPIMYSVVEHIAKTKIGEANDG
jgi:hypothetical protein